MARLTIREQIIGLVATLLLLLAGIGGLAASRIATINGHAHELASNWMPSITAVGHVSTLIGEYRATILSHILSTDPQQMATLDRRIDDLRREMANATRVYEGLISSPQETALYRNFQAAWGRYEAGVARLLELSRRNANAEAAAFMDRELRPLALEALRLMAELTTLNNNGGAAEANDAGDSARSALTLIAILGAGAVLVGLVFSLMAIRTLSRQMSAVSRPMARLAAGDLAAEVPPLPARTEMGGFARQLAVFKDALVAQKEADAQTLRDAEDKARRAATLAQLVAEFERSAAEGLRGMAGAVTELDAMAGSMTETARRGEESANGVSAAAGEAAGSVSTVASSAEELGASIGEVARQISETATVARRASEDARATDATVTTLSEAAQKIGDVVRLISGIAGQTNLLALNATIEAARAGEHGKGFAVVASEVKTLAAQTAKATEEIGTQIAAMQAETEKAVAAIRGIVDTIGRVDTITVQVAAAAEEQSVATQEIIRAVVSASSNTQRVSGYADQVMQGATATGAAATQVGASSRELSQRAEKLRKEVDLFLDGVRAA
ncbi:methyl-accepting chemotaxis protein [Falsiroseomonas sp.]|uniref:methyl-accepting chemotaxis protein n=1 Tax=Falsiroseomonas sp. TaxID=2870721 RepID=UPI003F708A39